MIRVGKTDANPPVTGLPEDASLMRKMAFDQPEPDVEEALT